MTDTLDETIKSRAATEPGFAVAYAILRVAAALETKRKRTSKPPQPDPEVKSLIG